MQRRALLKVSTATLALLAAGSVSSAARAFASPPRPRQRLSPSRPVPNRAPLSPQPYYPLPVGSIRPEGWLKRQLEIQAAGLTGFLGDIWPDVGPDSGWLGGKGESWERGPYYLDGLLPLAWQLESPQLKARAQAFIEWTLKSAHAGGMFGPASNDDWWPRMVMLKVLTQYHELTGDARVIPLMTDYFAYQRRELGKRPLRDWGRFRWQDQVVSMVWLYNRTGEAALVDHARLLMGQGWNWTAHFKDFPYKEPMTAAKLGLDQPNHLENGLKDLALGAHGVNIAMGVKASAVRALLTGSNDDRMATERELEGLHSYHGLPNGMIAADEHVAGRSPSQGVETCAVVETMFSLETALAISGDTRLADRLETIAYNALPGALTEDMWALQYDQQPNQVQSSNAKGPWMSNGPEANLFGLALNFGCCTANFHQGWPKLTSSLWMASADGGLTAMVYAPCSVETLVSHVPVRLVQATDYPFRDTVEISVTPERPVRFPLKLRIPGWAQDARVRLNGRPAKVDASPGGFAVLDRRWRKGDRVTLTLPSAVRRYAGYQGAVSLLRGPLVFSLPIGEDWRKMRDRGLGAADWQVFPKTPWRYAVNPAAASCNCQAGPVGAVPFGKAAVPVSLSIAARAIEDWPMREGYAAPPPASPVRSSAQETQLTLIPYASAKLRLTAFPLLAPSGGS